MKITLNLQPDVTVPADISMNVVGAFSSWPRRPSEASEFYNLATDSRFDPVVLN